MQRLVGLMFLFAFAALPAAAQDKIDGFLGRIHRNRSGQTMPYRLFIPPGYDKTQKYPLILWLHGAGSVGKDNKLQISEWSTPGTHLWTTPENVAKHPAFVVAPQCPAEDQDCWDDPDAGQLGRELILVLDILDAIQKEFSIDAHRLYVAGQSMGGYGTWSLITKRPSIFAAAIPLCGGGNPSFASRAAKTPIWAFHGDMDDNVPVAETRNMIAAVKKAGGNPRYTEYKGMGHEIWDRVFKEPGLVEWLFAQHK
jgi:predicted peptidase